MGELLGIGCTHAPHLQFTDEAMANVLRRLLKSDRLPAHLRDPQNWPEGMRAEWADDEAAAAARRHREIQVEAFRKARAVLDEFQPDFVLIWGDDQFENFKLDLLTPFCVFALDPVPLAPFHGSDGLQAAANVWNESTDLRWNLPGHQAAANHLAHELSAQRLRRLLRVPAPPCRDAEPRVHAHRALSRLRSAGLRLPGDPVPCELLRQ